MLDCNCFETYTHHSDYVWAMDLLLHTKYLTEENNIVSLSGQKSQVYIPFGILSDFRRFLRLVNEQLLIVSCSDNGSIIACPVEDGKNSKKRKI